jgi:transcription initiation factor TFIIIB Brf1 subunit/transcription initiation factor TFIIB
MKPNTQTLIKELVQIIERNNKKVQRHFNPYYNNHNTRNLVLKTQIKKICKDLNLKNETFYNAIAIIDNISSKFLLEEEVFSGISLVALSIAARIKESQSMIFLLNSLKQIKSNSNRKMYEKQILEELNYDANIVTPFDFINHFVLFDKTFEEINSKKIKPFLYLISKLTYLTVCDYNSNKYNSLVVALAIIMVARKIFKCKKLLPPFLEELSGFTEEVLSSCYRKIYFYGRKFIKELKVMNGHKVVTGKNTFK